MSEYIVEMPKEPAKVVRDGWNVRIEWQYKQREEIVRCRDCKHFTPKGTHKFENGKVNADYCDYVRGWMLKITPDGCRAGKEKRTNDN